VKQTPFERAHAGEWDEFARFLAFRCGITVREAREYVRVALPATLLAVAVANVLLVLRYG